MIVLNLDTVVVESLIVIKTNALPRIVEVAPRGYHSLSFRTKGENIISDGSVVITSNAHTLTFVPQGKSYTHHILTPSEQIVAHFTTKSPIGDDFENFTLPLSCNIEYLFYSLYNCWESGQKETDLQCMSVFYNILALIARNRNTTEEARNQLISESVTYMHAHYRESDFNIAKLYELAHISSAYYRRIFHKVYGCSPVEYLKNLRINYAKQLLNSGYHTIAEVAELSGFSTPTYFSYVFKKMTGCMPSEYRG